MLSYFEVNKLAYYNPIDDRRHKTPESETKED